MSTYLDFVQLLSGGTTIVGLSLAWLAIYRQQISSLSLDYLKKKCLLDSLQLELANLKPWTGHYPTNTFDFWWNNPDTQTWKMPTAKLVFHFSHVVIKEAASSAIQTGLTPSLVSELVQLEQAILVFEDVLDHQKQLVYANPSISWELTQKLIASTGDRVEVSEAEYALMRQNFELNWILHVTCIGNDDQPVAHGNEVVNSNSDERQLTNNGSTIPVQLPVEQRKNIHSCYKRTSKLLEMEIESLERDKKYKVHFYIKGFNIVVWFLALLGSLVLASSCGYLPELCSEALAIIQKPMVQVAPSKIPVNRPATAEAQTVKIPAQQTPMPPTKLTTTPVKPIGTTKAAVKFQTQTSTEGKSK